jgi:mannose-6-phosphate isomerase-like protein (cupin superfamily)
MQKSKFGLGVVVGVFALSMVNQIQGQGQTASPATLFPSGTATLVTNAEMMRFAANKPSESKPIVETMLRVANIGGRYNVGLALASRIKGKANTGPEHHLLTEVYHIISGSATLVTGGTYTPPMKENSQILIGPSANGGPVRNGVSSHVGPGDVVIIPPNTPHYFSEISSDQLVYLMDRIDTERVLKPSMQPIVFPDDPVFKQ